MSYHTTYHLTWSGGESRRACDHPSRAGAKFCEECGRSRALITPSEQIVPALRNIDLDPPGIDGYLGSEMTWYDHEEGMAWLSRKFPDVLFHLRGRGEEESDIWDLFALGGKVQKHRTQILRKTEPDESAWRDPEGR